MLYTKAEKYHICRLSTVDGISAPLVKSENSTFTARLEGLRREKTGILYMLNHFSACLVACEIGGGKKKSCTVVYLSILYFISAI